MSEALLVMVHGSPRPIANQEMFRVVEAFQARPEYSARFPIVQVGFMECNEPSIREAIDLCVAQGATAIVAVPYFLHTGTHVCQDLPALLAEGQARHPDITFRMGDYIGLSPRLTNILRARVQMTPASFERIAGNTVQ